MTGETPAGASVYTHVEAVEPTRSVGMPRETHWHPVWGWDEAPRLPYFQPLPYAPLSPMPGPEPGSLRVAVWSLPPHYPELDRAAGEEQGMHSTDSVDVVFVLEGAVCVQQADDDEVTLRRGDVLVQAGTAHNWRNPAGERCVLGTVYLGMPRGDRGRET